MMLASPRPPQIYRQFFTPAECRLLDSSPPETALSEISLLRILLMRLLAARARQPQVAAVGDPELEERRAHSAPKGERSNHPAVELSLKRQLSMLAAFSQAGVIMSSLVRFHARSFALDDPTDTLLHAFAAMDPYDL